MCDFKFNKYGDTLTDGELVLRVNREAPGIPEKKWVPAYFFDIYLVSANKKVGTADLRIGYTDDLVWYGGLIGYGIDEKFRGNSYASKACELIKRVAKDHGMDVLWITCEENNIASKRTLEKLGCSFVGIMDLPEYHDLYKRGQRRVRRYRWIVY
jgi:predicted acetyltransferase